MNKKKIDEYIPEAYKALRSSILYNEDKKGIVKTYRGYISSFGAAVTMGSIRAAVAYNMKEDTRKALMEIIFILIKDEVNAAGGSYESLGDYVSSVPENIAKEHIYNAAIAVKLAMNMFDLISESKAEESGS